MEVAVTRPPPNQKAESEFGTIKRGDTPTPKHIKSLGNSLSSEWMFTHIHSDTHFRFFYSSAHPLASFFFST